jgi:hypothetical protein
VASCGLGPAQEAGATVIAAALRVLSEEIRRERRERERERERERVRERKLKIERGNDWIQNG